MNICQVCHAATDADTCPMCGNASWVKHTSEDGTPVAPTPIQAVPETELQIVGQPDPNVPRQQRRRR